MYEQLIENLQNGINKIQVELNQHKAMVEDLTMRLRHNEGALMLAVNLQKEAKEATEAEAEESSELRSASPVATQRKTPVDGATKKAAPAEA